MSIRALLRVIIDSQAWLYANQMKLQAKLSDPNYVVSEDEFRVWEDEWKRTTAELAQEMTDADEA